jgi:acetate kinase
MDDFVNRHCGLIGVSQTTSDMRDLIARGQTDIRAREAVELFCHQAKKWIGALSAELGGLDTLVFAGGIGENSPPVRQQICRGLEFLGLRLDAAQNQENAAIISAKDSAISARVIQTNEELVIAQTVCRLI